MSFPNHLGHQELLNRAKRLAEEHGYKSAMMTFEVDPDFYLDVKDIEYLTSLEEKQRILTNMGIDYIFVLDFATSSLSIEISNPFL